MRVLICGPDLLVQELKNSVGDQVLISRISSIIDLPIADLLICFDDNIESSSLLKINMNVIVDAHSDNFKSSSTSENISGLNAWPGFIARPMWEIIPGNQSIIKILETKLGKKCLQANNELELISCRVVAMIINEAFYALGEGVSTKNEIDIAMKLGTNYPYGPFEWAEKIGVKRILSFLNKLAATDNRYIPAPALTEELTGKDNF